LTLLDKILQVIISGITSGSVYAILATALAVVYNVAKVFDMTQAEYIMLAGMLVCLFNVSGLPLALSIGLAIVIPLIFGLIIWLIILYRPSQNLPHLPFVMITFGLAMLIEGIAFIIFGTDQRTIRYYFNIAPIRISAATMSPQAPLIYGILCLMVVGLSLLFGRTLLGKGLRACHEKLLGARLMGINPKNMMFISYGLAVCIAAIGGAVMAPLTSVSYSMAGNLIIKALLAALVGGIYSFTGVIAGAMALGLLESLMAGFVSSAYASIITLAIFLVLLLFRPTGLLGTKEIRT
jgi:branched-chain amino acid transport system permease protein